MGLYGALSVTPTNFFPVTFSNVDFCFKDFLTFSFRLFAKLPCASPKLLNWDQDQPLKK